MILLSVDPGIGGCGCALWEGPKLLRAAYVGNEVADGHKGDLYERARGMAQSVAHWVQEPEIIGHAVIELPQTYGGRAAKGDTNDLIALATVCGALAATFAEAVLSCVVPREWKGNTPKEVTSARVLEAFSDDEVAQSVISMPRAKGLRHNVYDGIGIGLWWLKKQKVRK